MITASSIAQAIQIAAPSVQGVQWQRVTLAIGTGIATWVVAPAQYSLAGVTTGSAGSGAVLGKATITPQPIILPAAFASVSLVGVQSAIVASAIGIGACTAFNADNTYVGNSIGVGAGSDLSRINTCNATCLCASLTLAFQEQGLVGVLAGQFCTGIGIGVAGLFATVTGAGVVTGATGPAPAVGSSFSTIF